MRFALFVGFLLGLSASAQTMGTQPGQSSVGIQFQADYLENYVFRGRLFDPDPSYQGDLKIGISNWSYRAFYSRPEEEDGLGEQEFNHTVAYTQLRGKSVTTVGYRFYQYDGTKPDTQEFFYKRAQLTAWNPTIGMAFDFDTYKGFYVDGSLSRNYPVTRALSMQVFIGVGLSLDMSPEEDDLGNITDIGFFADDGFNHALTKLEFSYAFSPAVTASIGGHYSYADEDPPAELLGLGNDHFYARAGISIKLR